MKNTLALRLVPKEMILESKVNFGLTRRNGIFLVEPVSGERQFFMSSHRILISLGETLLWRADTDTAILVVKPPLH